MSRLLWSSLLLSASLLGCQQADVHPLPEGHVKGLVPLPATVLVSEDAPEGRGFRCEGSLSLALPEGWKLQGMTSWLKRAGLAWKRTEGEEGADWVFAAVERDLGEEGYVLEVAEDRVRIEARDEEAAFRAWTTLRQMMPPLCEQQCPSGFTLPAVRIEDAADLEHRGLLLDCCRHFMAPVLSSGSSTCLPCRR